jgi:predicted transcriptional regulator
MLEILEEWKSLVRGAEAQRVLEKIRRSKMSAITINVPDSLFEKLKEAAAKDQSTPEHFALLALAEKLSSVITVEYLEERAKRAKIERFEQLLSKVPDIEPEDSDRL